MTWERPVDTWCAGLLGAVEGFSYLSLLAGECVQTTGQGSLLWLSGRHAWGATVTLIAMCASVPAAIVGFALKP